MLIFIFAKKYRKENYIYVLFLFIERKAYVKKKCYKLNLTKNSMKEN